MHISNLVFALIVSLCKSSALFQRASDFVKNTAPAPATNETRLKVYALYTQATRGDCPQESGEPIDPVRRLKIEAWCAHRGMSKDEAMSKYVALIDELVPGWRDM